MGSSEGIDMLWPVLIPTYSRLLFFPLFLSKKFVFGSVSLTWLVDSFYLLSLFVANIMKAILTELGS